jgi:hypothetical protein
MYDLGKIRLMPGSFGQQKNNPLQDFRAPFFDLSSFFEKILYVFYVYVQVKTWHPAWFIYGFLSG